MINILSYKLITFLTIAVASFLIIFAHQANAQVDPFCSDVGAGTSYCSAQNQGGDTNAFVGTSGIIYTITNMVTLAAGVIAVIGVILGGFSYMTANGDASQIARAKNAIIYSLVGVVVAVLARSIVVFVLRRIG